MNGLAVLMTSSSFIIGGCALGWFVDSKIGSSPTGIISGLFVGLVLSLWTLFKNLSPKDPPR